jgi:hypothetical protein
MEKRSVLYSHHYPPRGRWWLEERLFLLLYVVLLFILLLFYQNHSSCAYVTFGVVDGNRGCLSCHVVGALPNSGILRQPLMLPNTFYLSKEAHRVKSQM